MDRAKINRISGIAPLIFSILAFVLVISAVLTGGEKGYADEGPIAHIFQLLIVAQLPCILLFVITANRTRVVRVAE